jgi:hypothetical protein
MALGKLTERGREDIKEILRIAERMVKVKKEASKNRY